MQTSQIKQAAELILFGGQTHLLRNKAFRSGMKAEAKTADDKAVIKLIDEGRKLMDAIWENQVFYSQYDEYASLASDAITKLKEVTARRPSPIVTISGSDDLLQQDIPILDGALALLEEYSYSIDQKDTDLIQSRERLAEIRRLVGAWYYSVDLTLYKLSN